MTRLHALLVTAVLAIALPVVAHAQQPARPAAPPPPQAAQKPPEPARCARYEAATTAAYGAYVRLVKPDVPGLGENGVDQSGLVEKLQELYEKLLEEAQNEDVVALRKAAALEIFGMHVQAKPVLDITRKKVCGLARMPDTPATLLDALTCAVIVSDEARRKEPGNRAIAKEMLAKARTQVPARASLADSARMLFDDVSRGLDGCY